MTLSHQTVTYECGCEVEQLHNPDEGIQPIPIVLNRCCERHEAIVKDKKRLTMTEFNKKSDEIIKRYKGMLDNNRIRHLNEFDNHPFRKEKKQAVQLMKQFKDTERHALVQEAKMNEERNQTVAFLDNHEQENITRLVTGLNSQYSMFAKEVHDAILAEQPPIIENDG